MASPKTRRQAEEKGPPPLEKLRFPSPGGNVEISVWENTADGESGSTRTVYSVTVQRNYYDGDEWKRSKSLFPGDLLVAAEGLRQAFVLIANMQQKK